MSETKIFANSMLGEYSPDRNQLYINSENQYLLVPYVNGIFIYIIQVW